MRSPYFKLGTGILIGAWVAVVSVVGRTVVVESLDPGATVARTEVPAVQTVRLAEAGEAHTRFRPVNAHAELEREYQLLGSDWDQASPRGPYEVSPLGL